MTARTGSSLPSNNPAPPLSKWAQVGEWPWWLIAAIGLVIYLIYLVLTDAETRSSFWFLLGQKPDALSLGQIFLS